MGKSDVKFFHCPHIYLFVSYPTPDQVNATNCILLRSHNLGFTKLEYLILFNNKLKHIPASPNKAQA